jgi:hypothetical protein
MSRIKRNRVERINLLCDKIFHVFSIDVIEVGPLSRIVC